VSIHAARSVLPGESGKGSSSGLRAPAPPSCRVASRGRGEAIGRARSQSPMALGLDLYKII